MTSTAIPIACLLPRRGWPLHQRKCILPVRLSQRNNYCGRVMRAVAGFRRTHSSSARRLSLARGEAGMTQGQGVTALLEWPSKVSPIGRATAVEHESYPQPPNSIVSQFERRIRAVLVADVVGYTRLMEADELETHTRYRALRVR